MKNVKVTSRHIKCIISIVVGTFLLSIATNGVFIPNQLLSGGVTGIAMLCNLLMGSNISFMIIAINVPLFLVGLFYLKKSFLAYSLFGMLMLSFWIEVTHDVILPVGNILSIVVVGGFLHGIGSGIIFKAEGSTGGIDIVIKILNKYFSLSMATASLALNGVIIFASFLSFGIDPAVLTLSTIFISSRVVNLVIDGVNHKKTVFIVTDEQYYEKISDHLMHDLARGITIIPAIGAYSKQNKFILYMTVGQREIAKVKRIVVAHDKNAFMSISEASQVIGRGKGFIHSQEIE
ncbi:MAG: hypothetical protein ATN36_01445 [Epulopiscium sp. Nele67-Bin005]|nr:MAG: hypothetical protein ATN36_01445 [Epulopiscium sp. Nele67-Bin005]